jgi:hypothetical protein
MTPLHSCDGTVTVQDDEDHSIDVWLKRADAWMYEKKCAAVDGCNKWCLGWRLARRA